MRAVLDTVIFVRALINPRSRWGRVLDLSDRYTVVVSADVVSEIVGTIYRPSVTRRFPSMSEPAHLDRVLSIIGHAETVQPLAEEAVCRDPNDDKFFAAALAGGADYIVSEDNDILAVAEYRGIRTVTAAQFLAILEST